MDTRLRILKEAGVMFSKYGLRSVTMDSIASELGISKRTLYETFKDKDDLVAQAIEEGAKAHKQYCQTIIAESENVIEAIFKIGKLNHELFSKINPVFFEDFKKYHSEIFNRVNQRGDLRDYKITESLLNRGANEGIFSDDIDLELVNLFLHKIIDLAHCDEFREFGNEKIFSAMFLPYLIGISTDKGKELIKKYFNKFNS
ncbi:MAG: TetR/AcrR family transcriptional regulator [Bacteroidales bacterium]|nr:TetR/AcrR family transcriptional regulator [Bacteroidales bacterium]